MFDDFRPSSHASAARKRLGGSVAAAAVLYVAMGAFIVAGTRAATKTMVEKLTQVEFAPPPPPPPPPPLPLQNIANARPLARRRELKAPPRMPDQKPRDSDAPVAPSEPGPVDGFLNGVEGGEGSLAVAPARPPPPPPPPPKAEPVLAPVAQRGNAPPGYTASARRKQIEGVVVVSFDVLENGTVANVQIVSGPEELRDNVLKAVATWHFEPARQGGRPVRCHQIKSIRFQLTDI
jgi:protein TonB